MKLLRIAALVTLLSLTSIYCAQATWLTKGNCQKDYCNEYPVFKVTWSTPDGVQVWEKVCNLQILDSSWWVFCVDGKSVVIQGGIMKAEELKY